MPRSPIVTIVDDDPSVCEGLTGLLTSMGFAAEAFERADQFLKSDRAAETACLIADVQMPGMSGLELHDRLVRSGKNIPTILITALPEDADRGRALRAGVKCYLAKPFSDKDLLTCIQSGLGSSGAGMHS